MSRSTEPVGSRTALGQLSPRQWGIIRAMQEYRDGDGQPVVFAPTDIAEAGDYTRPEVWGLARRLADRSLLDVIGRHGHYLATPALLELREPDPAPPAEPERTNLSLAERAVLVYVAIHLDDSSGKLFTRDNIPVEPLRSQGIRSPKQITGVLGSLVRAGYLWKAYNQPIRYRLTDTGRALAAQLQAVPGT